MAAAAPLPAATIVANTTIDEYGAGSDCSLREAIRAANTDSAFGGCGAGSGTDTILLVVGVHKLTRPGRDEDANATGDLDISSSLALEPAFFGDASNVVIDAGFLDRAIDITGAVTVTINGLAIVHGRPQTSAGQVNKPGGAIRIANNAGLILQNARLESNIASNGGALHITDSSAAIVDKSALVHNQSTFNGGAILLTSTASGMTMTSSTISGNQAGTSGGGVEVRAGNVSFNGVTIVRNEANFGNAAFPGPGGGGVFVFGAAPVVDLRNSILVDNLSHNLDVDCAGTFRDLTYDQLLGPCDHTGSGLGTDFFSHPQLVPLFDPSDHGLPAHFLARSDGVGAPQPPGSGGISCTLRDQWNRLRAAPCDAGAISPVVDYLVTSPLDTTDANPGDGVCAPVQGNCTLRAAIQEANAHSDLRTIFLAVTPTLSLAPSGDENAALDGDLDITGHLILMKPHAQATAAFSDRIFDLIGAHVLITEGLIKSGATSSDGGGLRVRNGSEAMLWNVTLAGNSAVNGGGVALLGASKMYVHNSSLVYNTASASGGGIYQDSSINSLTVDNSTLSRNAAAAFGGGVAILNGSAILAHVTIAANMANAVFAVSGSGGGLLANAAASVLIGNSIVWGNQAGTGAGSIVADDCRGNLFSLGYVWRGVAGGCALAGNLTGGVLGVDPGFYGLQPATSQSIGNEHFLPLHPGSPALEQIPGDDCRSTDLALAKYDQLGDSRSIALFTELTCSYGAVEGRNDRIFLGPFQPTY